MYLLLSVAMEKLEMVKSKIKQKRCDIFLLDESDKTG